MIENLTKGECGACGGDSFKLYTNDVNKHILVECEGCSDLSHIKVVTSAKLDVVWDDHSDGILHFSSK